MHTHQKSSHPVATIGLDIGKNTFHLVGLDKRGAIAMRIKVSRNQLIRRLVNLPRCLIGLEAGSGSHHIARQIKPLGHDVRLIPAQDVKPFLKGHKNDYRDAEANAEAVQRPTMNFVAIKTPEQSDLLSLRRVRSRPCPPAHGYHQSDPRLSHRTRHHCPARPSAFAQSAA
jgi:transposase